MGKTVSRLIIEAAIIIGVLSIVTGISLKMVYITSIYTPLLFGLPPLDFVYFGAVCFFFAIAFTGRRILKHMEEAIRIDGNRRD